LLEAAATIGMTASAKPMPRITITWKNDAPSVTAASSSTPYQPIITVSVSEISVSANCPPISGPPMASVARICWLRVMGRP
jgi:hypothetical protein